MEIREFMDRVLTAAQAAGMEPAEVCASTSESFSVRVRLGEMEDYQVSDSLNVTLRGNLNGRIGTSSTQALDEESIDMLVRGVMESAQLVETEDQEEILPPEAAQNKMIPGIGKRVFVPPRPFPRCRERGCRVSSRRFPAPGGGTPSRC